MPLIYHNNKPWLLTCWIHVLNVDWKLKLARCWLKKDLLDLDIET